MQVLAFLLKANTRTSAMIAMRTIAHITDTRMIHHRLHSDLSTLKMTESGFMFSSVFVAADTLTHFFELEGLLSMTLRLLEEIEQFCDCKRSDVVGTEP